MYSFLGGLGCLPRALWDGLGPLGCPPRGLCGGLGMKCLPDLWGGRLLLCGGRLKWKGGGGLCLRLFREWPILMSLCGLWESWSLGLCFLGRTSPRVNLIDFGSASSSVNFVIRRDPSLSWYSSVSTLPWAYLKMRNCSTCKGEIKLLLKAARN